MFHPIGSLPPAVYWRRRIMVAGVLGALVLVALTVVVLSGGGSTANGAAGTTVSHSSSSGSPAGGSSSASGPGALASGLSPADGSPTVVSSAAATASAGGAAGSSTSGSTNTVTPVGCLRTALAVKAAVKAPAYKVRDEPVLMLQVTNTGAANCVQDLADSEVELRVYNGAARVWGSHDCHIEPGSAVQTLVAGSTVGVQVTWSGFSSQPGCIGTRQRVGAGTYTVYAYLAGTQGTPAQFTIS
jgi:hypothetical protein